MRRFRVLTVLCGVLVTAIAIGSRPARSGPHLVCSSPSISIVKHLAQLTLHCEEGDRLYPVTFGASPVGHKQKRGDERTPEGDYHIAAKVKSERFHRFLKVSYPNEGDRRRAAQAGVDPGGGIGIHGVRAQLAGLARLFIRGGRALSSSAWGPTDGCIGMTNEDVEDVFAAVPAGTAVHIAP